MWRYVVLICMVVVHFSVALAEPLKDTYEDRVLTDRLAQLSLEEKVGQLFMVAFRQEDDQPVTIATGDVEEELKKYHVGGVILFAENFLDVEQTARLAFDLQQAAGRIPLLIAVDQEGGRVNRYHFGTELPGNMALGASWKTSNAYMAGNILGSELKALGINVNLAPVLDINSNQDNPVIGTRSFGADKRMVTKLGAAYIEGLHAGGVMAAVKHFPGHGDTSVDSHLGLPMVGYGKSRLHSLELWPFRKNLPAADMVMAAHVAFPTLDNTKVISRQDGRPVFLPASLSYKILTKLLRGEFGYEGVIITDALGMKAITDHFGPEKAVVGAIQAGADILLMPSDLPKAYAAVVAAVTTGTISEERIDQSVLRILRLKRQWIQTGFPNGMISAAGKDVVGSKEHQDWETNLARDAVTLLKNEAGILPLPVKRGNRIVLVAPSPELLITMKAAAWAQAASDRYPDMAIAEIDYGNCSELTADHKRRIHEAEYILLATHSSTLASRTPGQTGSASFAAALTQYARQANKKVIVMATGTPYDITYLQEAQAYLAVYGANAANVQAGMAAVFGDLNPPGKLPVAIQNQGKAMFKLGYGHHD